MKQPADHAVRQRIATDLDTTFVVEAAAGTGKTTALVGRIVALLRTGRARLEQIVAVTFTEKAAGEMKLRLRAAIEAARRDAAPTERVRFDAALEELEAARMGTIHGLCADLLRERPVQARIDPMFAVAEQDEQQRLYDEAFDGWFQRVLDAPPEGVRRILRRDAWRDEDRPRWLLHAAGRALVDKRDFDGAWARPPFDRDTEIDGFLDDLFELTALSSEALHPQDYLARQVEMLAHWVEDLRHHERVNGRDYDGMEASLRQLRSRRYKWGWKGLQSKREFAPGWTRQAVRDRRDALKGRLDDLVRRCEMDLAPCLQADLKPVVARYLTLERRAGVVDFHDLLQHTRDLLVRDDAVRAELQQRFRYLLVDEFQDTDPLQAEILLLLASADPTCRDPYTVVVEPGKLFIVGDPKQSIYRFRRADVAFYQQVKAQLVAQAAEVLPLSTSFRGDPRIQEVVNAAFEPRMQGGTQADYVPLDRWRDEVPDRPAVIALPAPEIHGRYGKVWRGVIEGGLPDAVAAWLGWLFDESAWKVLEPGTDDTWVPVRPRHVCLLFKRFQTFGRSVTTPYTHALEKREIPHVLVGGRSYHDREEVLAVRAALAAIERPDDELSVFATLKGPLFAVPDDALLAWREQVGPLQPLRPVDEDALAPIHATVHEALQVLGRLHRGRNRRPVSDTLHSLLEATRAHAGLANWVAGEQALANVLRVAQLAQRFEKGGATSFRAFLDHLADEARRGESAEAPVVEEGTEGVRVMTVHSAKGLEFPVVVLCDIGCAPTWTRPSRWVDPVRRVWAEPLAGCMPADLEAHEDEVLRQDAEEADRLLYVAATRSRDLLVVPVVGDEPLPDSWVEPLYPALYPPADDWRVGRPAPACPAFGDDSVARRPANAHGVPVHPGLHRPERGAHDVVWWDPSILALTARRHTGLRDQDLLVEDAEGRAAKSTRAHKQWIRQRQERLEQGARPTLDVRTPTELAHGAEGQVPIFSAIAVEQTEVAGTERPHGRRFGTLVHAVLADVALNADAGSVQRSTRLHGRLVGAPPEEVDAAAVAVQAALRHPILQRAARSPDCRREVPLTLHADEDRLVEGTADLAFLDPATDRWLVVDFKTDVELDAMRASYEVQVSWYVRALQAATGRPADGLLLRV